VYIHIHTFSNLIYLTYLFLTLIYEFLLFAKLNWCLVHKVILCVSEFIYIVAQNDYQTLGVCILAFLEGKMLQKHRLFSQTLQNYIVMFTIRCDMHLLHTGEVV